MQRPRANRRDRIIRDKAPYKIQILRMFVQEPLHISRFQRFRPGIE